MIIKLYNSMWDQESNTKQDIWSRGRPTLFLQ